MAEQTNDASLADARALAERLRARLASAVRGRDDVIELLLIALIASGHVLLEDYPGSGKTTLAKALGESIEGPAGDLSPFRRIQFTPDLLPSDVTGTTVFEPSSGRFSFRPGPLFAHVVLADEINRTSPKVQSAMLEAMAERQVTVDNHTYPLDDLFFVVATQNPLDLAGTFPLPAAQLDRFLFKIRMKHIDRESELAVLSNVRGGKVQVDPRLPRVSRDAVLSARASIEQAVHVAPAVKECLVDIAEGTRTNDRFLQGASTRALVLLLPALQARAMLKGRAYVSSEDIEALVVPAFGHRVELVPGENDVTAALGVCMQGPLERLARSTMRR